MGFKKIAKRFLELGLNPVPVELGSKAPVRKDYTSLIPLSDVENFDFEEIGVSTGYASGNLEGLDFDTKNVENPKVFMETFESLVPKELYEKLVIQETGSGGQHYIYRCITISGNQKLARNKAGEATIETRGVGGYIKTFPSKGYRMLQGDFSKVQTITESERNILLTLARQRDELLVRDVEKRYSAQEKDYLKRFPKYNSDPEIGIKLLEDFGWTFHSNNGEWYNMTRPNSKSGDLHGGYNKEGLFFQAFSTAQDTFQEKKGYNNSSILAETKFGGDYSKAYSWLYSEGLGVDDSEIVSDEDDELDFLSDSLAENEMLEQIRKGDIPMGVSTGWHALDKYFVLKKNTFYFLLGVENIGKSTILSSLMAATKVLYGSKWGVSSPESSNAVTRRNLIQASTGRKLRSFENEPLLYAKYLTDSRNHFYLIRNDRHWGLEEVLENGKKLFQKYGIDYLVIDPYSFYDGTGDYKKDLAFMSKIRVFALRYCSVLVVDHTNTDFVRKGMDENGFLRMPSRYDAVGGNMKTNKCDDFIVVHRVKNHPDKEVRTTMQIAIGKVKDEDTGGSTHLIGQYSELVYETRDGFTGFWDDMGNNPIYAALKAKKRIQSGNKEVTGLPQISPEDAF